MMKAVLALGLCLIGCAAKTAKHESATPLVCEMSDRSGTYLSVFTTKSGNCGDLPEELGRLDDASGLPDYCAFDADDRWSENDCKLERAYTCVTDSGVTTSAVAVTEQRDESGATLSGLVTLRATNGPTGETCVGTYAVTLTRQ